MSTCVCLRTYVQTHTRTHTLIDAQTHTCPCDAKTRGRHTCAYTSDFVEVGPTVGGYDRRLIGDKALPEIPKVK